MSFFENLIKNIPFDNLGEITVIGIIIILIIGFLMYMQMQNKKSIGIEKIKMDAKKEVDLKRLESIDDIAVGIAKNVNIQDSSIGTTSSNKAGKIKVNIGEGAKISNSKVGKIDGK